MQGHESPAAASRSHLLLSHGSAGYSPPSASSQDRGPSVLQPFLQIMALAMLHWISDITAVSSACTARLVQTLTVCKPLAAALASAKITEPRPTSSYDKCSSQRVMSHACVCTPSMILCKHNMRLPCVCHVLPTIHDSLQSHHDSMPAAQV